MMGNDAARWLDFRYLVQACCVTIPTLDDKTIKR